MIFEKGYLFPPSFLDILETFTKASDRDALNMAIHRYMYRGEVPEFKSMSLKRTWLGVFPYLKKSRDMALLKDAEGQDEVGTTSRQGQDQVETTSAQGHDIKAKGNGIIKALNKGGGEAMAKDIYNTADSAAARPAPPTLEQAQEYARAEGIRTNVRKFHSYYSARRWIFPDGEPVRDWKALLITWASRDREDEKPEPEGPKPPAQFDKCPACGGSNVSQHFNYAMCNDPKCQKSYTWNGKAWRQDA